jgi:hypothetical protein
MEKTEVAMNVRNCVTMSVTIGLVCTGGPALAATLAPRHVMRIDELGAHLCITYGEGEQHPSAPGGFRGVPGIIWHVNDPASITYSVCVADTTDESWIGHELNNERFSYHQTTGDGTPIWELDLLPENVSTVNVASAEDASLGVLFTADGSSPVQVRAFDDSSGTTPIWTYTFGAEYLSAPRRDVDVAADGSIVAAVGWDSTNGKSLVVILDGASGAELNTLSINAFVTGVELSDDGSRAMLTEGPTARIIETAGLTTLHSFAVSGAGGYHRLSRDGTVAAAGGFNYAAWREENGTWSQVYNGTEAQQWFGAGIALSGDGKYMFLPSYNYATGYLDLTYRVIDLEAGSEIARTTTSGSGGLQDTIQGAQASSDGTVFAVASWGTQDNAHPEVQVFDRDLNLIGSIDTPGSPFSIDMSRDGRFVVVGGKHIHANISGNGSDTYAYDTGVEPTCPADLTGDGAVNVFDLLGLLEVWGPCPGCPADLNGDDVVNVFDLLDLLDAWGPC